MGTSEWAPRLEAAGLGLGHVLEAAEDVVELILGEVVPERLRHQNTRSAQIQGTRDPSGCWEAAGGVQGAWRLAERTMGLRAGAP